MAEGFESTYNTVRQILSENTIYQVPLYQRNFSWEVNDQIDMFWSDLCKSLEKNHDHFLGHILITKTDKNNLFEILDGQQRLVTITILFAVLRDKFHDERDEARKELAEKVIIAEKDIDSLKPKPRLILNKMNKDFFYSEIQEGMKKLNKDYKKITNTNKLIADAYYYFDKKIDENLRVVPNHIEYLNSIYKHVLEKFGAIKTIVDDKKDAYRLFMPLNFRGLELSAADLFKTHTINEASGAEKEEIAQTWDDMSEKLNKIGMTRFLRHFWASKIANINEEDLYEEFEKYLEDNKSPNKNLVKENEKITALSFTRDLAEEAEIYNALANPTEDAWKDNEIKTLLSDIQTLNMTQCLPLLLSGYKKFEGKKFVNLLGAIIKFSFRYITIGGLNNKILEKMYSEIAIKIRKGEINDMAQILKEFKKKDIDEAQFEATFKKKQINNEKIAKYILRTIEDFIAKDESEKVSQILTLEHILPVNPDEEWKTYLNNKGIMDIDNYVDSLKNRIGNMTLLTVKKNRKAQNKFFTKKRDEIYKNTRLEITKWLLNNNDWTGKEINERQEMLLKYAKKIWTLDK